jgi:tight adherence protein C
VLIAAPGRQRPARDPGGDAARDQPAGAAAPTPSPIASLGALLRRLGGHSPDPGPDRRAGWAAIATASLLVVAPPLAAVPLAWALLAPEVIARRACRRHDALLADQLPDVVDLLALTTAAGLPVSAALAAIGDRPGGPLGEAMARAAAHVRHGGTTAEALSVLAGAGPPARALVDALAQHDRYGSPLLPALERVGIEARARRRRQAEEAARRLPVTLLFPLVLTTFPAFVLLTVVPLLAGSLGSLSLSEP